MSARTIVAASKVDDALHKVAACAETLSDNATQNPYSYFEGRTEDIGKLRESLKDLKEAEKAMADLVASESKTKG